MTYRGVSGSIGRSDNNVMNGHTYHEGSQPDGGINKRRNTPDSHDLDSGVRGVRASPVQEQENTNVTHRSKPSKPPKRFHQGLALMDQSGSKDGSEAGSKPTTGHGGHKRLPTGLKLRALSTLITNQQYL